MLETFNGLPLQQAEAELLACCAAPAWAREVAAGRPYRAVAELLDTGEAAFAKLTWAELAEALAAHPRIGQRSPGPSESRPSESREAEWSRREQSGVDGAQEALAEVNRAYEDRFGRVFLIFATGKSAEDVLAAARERLGNDEATERGIVREELRKIVLLRLENVARE